MPDYPENFRCGFIGIVGRPNVGKSTLLNKLIGDKLAAVSPKAQTTRRRFRGIRTDEDSQMIFVDTPGVHVAVKGEKLNEFYVAEALDVLEDSDVFVYVIDGSREFRGNKPGTDEAFLIEALEKQLAKKNAPLFILLNKMDIWEKGANKFSSQREIMELIDRLKPAAVIPFSAKTGKGIDALVKELKAVLPEGPRLFPEDELTDQNLRVIAAELIQEKLFYFLGEEVPYSSVVEITRFDDPSEERKLPEIDATIHVERDSQKAMVVGKGGAKIKEIGQAARADIEKIVGGKVVLKLHVKVNPKWTKEQKELKRFGFVLEKRP